MNKYYFLISSIALSNDMDPAQVVMDKYKQGPSAKVYYGNGVAVCMIESNETPNITEIVQMKTEAEILELSHPNLPDFNGSSFLTERETPHGNN